MKFKLLIFFLFLFFKVLATGQESNYILISGKEYQLLNDPLENYFIKHPNNHPIYGKKFAIKNEKGEQIISMSTGNWRGYVAYFEIINDKLFLTDIKIKDVDTEKQISVFNRIFNTKNLVELNYSGILTIPNGEFINSDNFGFSNYYSSYLIVTIRNDNIEKMKELKNEDYIKFKFRQFKAFQTTKEYKTAYKNYLRSNRESMKWDLSNENTKDLSQEEINKIKKQYSEKPTKEKIDIFFVYVVQFRANIY